MKRILLLTDFSANARKAVTTALRLYGKNNQFFLMNTYYMPMFGASRGDLYHWIEDDSSKKLDEEIKLISEKIDLKDFRIELIAERGFDDGVVIHFIRSKGIDLVVLGKGNVNNLIGSFTASIAHNSPVAVLIVPAEYECNNIEKVVFATDLQAVNKKMLVSLIDFIKQNNSELLVLNVYKEAKPDSKEYEEHINGYLQGIKHSFHYVKNNSVVDGITEFTEQNKADQLVILNRKDSLIERLFYVSMTQKLTTHSKRPIMVIHD